MASSSQRILAVAVRCGRLGCVVLDRGGLAHWEGSRRGASSVDRATKVLKTWIKHYRPDVLVTENPDRAGRKRGRQLRILRAFVDIGQEADVLNIVVPRHQRFANVYEEAAFFADRYPEIRHLLPKKPPIWGNEPYRLIFFEAIALLKEAGLLPPDATETTPTACH